ncbi:MAG: hypothetical protein HY049_01895 [Acidobacteria bacterium]|nr:hypothetical protein [Acidobacteriota bacterium]
MRAMRPVGSMLAVVAVLGFGWGVARANCRHIFGGEAIFQCAGTAWFDPAPFPVTFDPNEVPTNITAVFWQVGFGNQTLNDASGTAGTGIGAGGEFNGNDQGNWKPELRDAHAFLAPLFTNAPGPGSVCLRSNNWGNTGIDGCVDNPRDAALPDTFDGFLNPLFDVQVWTDSGHTDFVPSGRWIQDSPMMVLLREGTGNYFAVAAVSTLQRTVLSGVRPGFYDFTDVSTGQVNPITGAGNVVPWQSVPGVKGTADPLGLVRGVGSDPNDVPNGRNVLLGWNDAVIYSDNATRPSTNATVSGGMGTAEVGPLVRYVVESQTPVDPNNPIGSLNPSGWSAAETHHNPDNSALIHVPAGTCVRLHTYFGHEPDTSTVSVANCRLGHCGDLGYDVASPPSCIAAPLASETPIDLTAVRLRTGVVSISWKGSGEITTTSYRIESVGKRGVTVLGTVQATATGTGMAASYTFPISITQMKGARTIQVVALPSGATRSMIIR